MNNNTEKMNLKDYYKFKMYAWSGVFLFMGAYLLNSYFEGNRIINNALKVIALIIMILFAAKMIRCNVENGDELSNINIQRSHSLIAKVILGLSALAYIIITIFEISVTVKINSDKFIYIWVMLLSLFFAAESFLFLHFDGENTDESEEE